MLCKHKTDFLVFLLTDVTFGTFLGYLLSMTAQQAEMLALGQVPELTFEWRLRMAMKQAGMTQPDLAEAIGMTSRTVDRWLNRGATPRRGQIMACALATGVPVIWLEKGIDPTRDESGQSDLLPRLDSNQEPSD